MSFYTGQKVVCINDQFPAQLYEFAFQIPGKGTIYTVREVKKCRHVVTRNRELGLHLAELCNPTFGTRDEPFFSAWRFRPWEDELDEEEEETEVLELAGSC